MTRLTCIWIRSLYRQSFRQLPWCSTVGSTGVFVDWVKWKRAYLKSRGGLGPRHMGPLGMEPHHHPDVERAEAVLSCYSDSPRGTLALRQCDVTNYALWLHNCMLQQSGNTLHLYVLASISIEACVQECPTRTSPTPQPCHHLFSSQLRISPEHAQL